VSKIVQKLLSNGTTKLFSTSDSRSEYKPMIRSLTGENKSIKLESEMINESLLEQACEKLGGAKEINIIHDPSDIRKPHSKKTVNLGKVRALNGDIINGYSTHNSIAIEPGKREVHFLSHKLYSNNDELFLKREEINKLKKEVLFEGHEEAKKLYDSGEYFNKKTLSIDEIKKVGRELKKSNNTVLITHILDREFDDNEYMNVISEDLSQDYIIRAKKSRTIEEKREDGKKIKLIESDFAGRGEKIFQKLKIGDKVTQDGRMIISWHEFDKYNAVKIKVYNRKGESSFKDDMLILTNKKIKDLATAYQIYTTYLSRSKIEYVFKFLKEGLGWEKLQIQEFKAIQRLLSICFYAASYLYEIGEEKAYDDYAILLAEIGGGKGKVTRHFIVRGIQQLLNHLRVSRILSKKELSQEEQIALSNSCEILI